MCGTRFAGKSADQYLTPTRTRAERPPPPTGTSGRQSFKNTHRGDFMLFGGAVLLVIPLVAGGPSEEERAVRVCVSTCPDGWFRRMMPATCWRTRRASASTKNDSQRGNYVPSLFASENPSRFRWPLPFSRTGSTGRRVKSLPPLRPRCIRTFDRSTIK